MRQFNEPQDLPAAAEAQVCSSHRYFELPAGVMVKIIDGEHRPYTPLRTEELESPEFLESIAPGLSTYKDTLDTPGVTDELEQAMASFEKGVRYMYKEGEFEYRNDPLAADDSGARAESVAIDREGWGPGVLETVLWDRRKGSAERQKWKRRQERARRRQERAEQRQERARQPQLEGEDGASYQSSSSWSSSSSSRSSSGSSRSSSSSDSASSESTSGSGSSSSDEGSGGRGAAARPTSINRAIGSENVGFKLLSKLGWQKGQGLGAAGDGITEPIRLPTRFSSVRQQGARGSPARRGKGKRVERASLGTGRTGDTRVPEIGDDEFESYRKQKSSAYKQTTAALWQRDAPSQE
ncbi:SURP and G-patch domain-containing protein 1 [Coemansia biformis]|uniref:SURP and G-patch domain-containing protein 1 n=1 Tax=Coemansia biformis TaxID=1286918 RepID=A0A9W7Y9X2_9FUNG|nr:SURP and G-patch domain-containing protein 1 [Coemansia biformis]